MNRAILQKPRLARTRESLGIENPQLGDLLTEYRTWVNYKEWMVFKGIEDLGPYEVPLVHYKVAKASKRGNDVYNWRVRKRLKVLDKIKSKPATLGYFSRGIAKPLTAAIFITLTYSGDMSLGDAWVDIGPDFDRWRARVRARYGKFEFIRCWEAHKGSKKNNYVHKGYPHIHVLLIFQDAEFNVFRHNRKWRIEEKADFEWSHGWVDVQACPTLKDGISYIAKYIGKTHALGRSQGHNLTLALTWFYRKQSWSISRAISDLIRTLHDSNFGGLLEGGGDAVSNIKWTLEGFLGGYPLQLILDDALLGFTHKILAKQYWDIYGSVGWSDFDSRSGQLYGADDYQYQTILKKPTRGGKVRFDFED